MDHRPVIIAETLGFSGARFISFGQGNQDKPRRGDEVFFTVKKRVCVESDGKKAIGFARSEHGYISMNCGMEKIFMTLFRDRPDNRSMECIEWEDFWNIVFEDGIYISSRSCRMEKSFRICGVVPNHPARSSELTHQKTTKTNRRKKVWRTAQRS